VNEKDDLRFRSISCLALQRCRSSVSNRDRANSSHELAK
jgi:hypothetical protein